MIVLALCLVGVVTFANEYVAGGEVCHPRLLCFDYYCVAVNAMPVSVQAFYRMTLCKNDFVNITSLPEVAELFCIAQTAVTCYHS